MTQEQTILSQPLSACLDKSLLRIDDWAALGRLIILPAWAPS